MLSLTKPCPAQRLGLMSGSSGSGPADVSHPISTDDLIRKESNSRWLALILIMSAYPTFDIGTGIILSKIKGSYSDIRHDIDIYCRLIQISE